jgi:hypothetical protein
MHFVGLKHFVFNYLLDRLRKFYLPLFQQTFQVSGFSVSGKVINADMVSY